MRDTLAIISTVVGAVLALTGALLMRDHVRLVEIVTLFGGAFGAGAGVGIAVGVGPLPRSAGAGASSERTAPVTALGMGRDSSVARARPARALSRAVSSAGVAAATANTAMQIVLVIVVLAELAFKTDFVWVTDALVYLSGLLTVASAAAYLVAWLRHMHGYGESKDANR